jgi:hypothetical protein
VKCLAGFVFGIVKTAMGQPVFAPVENFSDATPSCSKGGVNLFSKICAGGYACPRILDSQIPNPQFPSLPSSPIAAAASVSPVPALAPLTTATASCSAPPLSRPHRCVHGELLHHIFEKLAAEVAHLPRYKEQGHIAASSEIHYSVRFALSGELPKQRRMPISEGTIALPSASSHLYL